MRVFAKVFSFIVAVGLSTSVFAQDELGRLMSLQDRENLAQEVVNLIVAKAEPGAYSFGREGVVQYRARVHNPAGIYGVVYEVGATMYSNGRADLSLSFYLTNRNLSGLKPEDVIIDDLIWGQPKIFQEARIFDAGARGVVDAERKFTKRKGSTLLGFTPEERDKKAGVRESLFRQGMVWQHKRFGESGWAKASPKEIDETQDEYLSYLKVVRVLLEAAK